jgi:hypothetical protein
MNDNHTDNPTISSSNNNNNNNISNNIAELPIPQSPSPHQLLAKCLRLVETQNIEEVIVIMVDSEGNIDRLHSGLTLERALYYVSLAQRHILNEASKGDYYEPN